MDKIIVEKIIKEGNITKYIDEEIRLDDLKYPVCNQNMKCNIFNDIGMGSGGSNFIFSCKNVL